MIKPNKRRHSLNSHQLKRFLSLAANMQAVVSFDGYFTYLNPGWQSLFGLPTREFMSHPLLTFVHPDDYQLVERALADLSHRVATLSFEARYGCPDGPYHWLQWQASSFAGESQIYVVARDVTRYKTTLQTLQAIMEETAPVTAGDFFRSLTCNLASTLGVRYAFVSECTDLTRSRARSLAFWVGKEFGNNFEYALAGTPCENVMAGEACYYPQEIQALFPEDVGLVRLNLESYAGLPLTDSAGQILGHLAVLDEQPLRDELGTMAILRIFAARAAAELERKHVEDKLARRVTELETVAKVGTAVSTNLNAQELLQAVVDLTKSSFELYHVHIYLLDEVEERLVLTAGADEVGRQLVAEGWTIPLDHSRSLVARTSRTRQGVIANNVGDSPEFMPNALLPYTRAEMAVPMCIGNRLLGVLDVQADKVNYFTPDDVRVYTILATQVAVALQNANLYAEQAATVVRLREVEQLKSAFLASMSHELRTPLNCILGFTDVILMGIDGPLTATMESDLNLVQKSGHHLLSLINDVLDMAKIEAGKMSLSPERFDLRELLAEVVDIIGSLAREKSLDLQLICDCAQQLELEADRTRLRQVFLNLVGNAIKFTTKGGVTIDAVHQNGGMLISVRDSGDGISPEKSQLIFEPFHRLDNPASQQTAGTGLGLPISRRLVELHNGRLWVESSGIAGEGATFFVELPANCDHKQNVNGVSHSSERH
jgi:PAS domain S-box-containing protein